MVIGVNGVGKTTTIAKLAHYDRRAKKFLVAADTFRAAAGTVEIWGQRVGVPVINRKPA
jgi:fused signal recognition particle receptor